MKKQKVLVEAVRIHLDKLDNELRTLRDNMEYIPSLKEEYDKKKSDIKTCKEFLISGAK